MLYPSRIAKQKLAMENLNTENLGDACDALANEKEAPVHEVPVYIEPTPEDTEAAELLLLDNAQINKSSEVADILTQSNNDVDTLTCIKNVATEALSTGGLTFKTAVIAKSTVDKINNRYGLRSKAVGMENFLYEDSKKLATEELITSIVDTLTALVKAIGSAAGELADVLIGTTKRLIYRGKDIKKDADLLRYKLDNMIAYRSVDVGLVGSAGRLKINDVVDIDGCIDLASKEMNVTAIAKAWQGLWARKGNKSTIYQFDFQELTTEFLEPISTPASKSAAKALPKRLDQLTPVNVFALPGDVYVSTYKPDDGIVYTKWSEGARSQRSAEVLPALDDKERALSVLSAAWQLGDILETDLNHFVKASNSVQAAAQELVMLKAQFRPDEDAIKQAKENIAAAYACENAILRSVWNTAEGLLDYAKKSIRV